MIVVTIDFHEALPIVVTAMIFAMMITIVIKINLFFESHILEIICYISYSREKESSPVLEWPFLEVYTGILSKKGGSCHLSLKVPRPFVKGTRNMR